MDAGAASDPAVQGGPRIALLANRASHAKDADRTQLPKSNTYYFTTVGRMAQPWSNSAILGVSIAQS